MTDRLTPGQLRDLADIFERGECSTDSEALREEAARREAEAKPLEGSGFGARAGISNGERKGPGSAAASKRQGPQAWGPYQTLEEIAAKHGVEDKPAPAADDLVAHLDGLALGLEQRGEKSAAHRVRQAVDRIEAQAREIAELRISRDSALRVALADGERAEADKAELVAALEMFNGPITHATFERARMTLAKHGGA